MKYSFVKRAKYRKLFNYYDTEKTYMCAKEQRQVYMFVISTSGRHFKTISRMAAPLRPIIDPMRYYS